MHDYQHNTTMSVQFSSSLSQRLIFIFFVADVMSNYLSTDGLKKFSLLPESALRPEARGICHICHMVNPALGVNGECVDRLGGRELRCHAFYRVTVHASD